MRELASLTVLAIFLYDAPHATACREDEHALLLGAIEGRRGERAVALMLEHLDHIESSLDLSPRRDAPVDLAAALRRGLRPACRPPAARRVLRPSPRG
jgi:DNA-binding GntR family transcriptional regulator